jgi:hypothetical protein
LALLVDKKIVGSFGGQKNRRNIKYIFIKTPIILEKNHKKRFPNFKNAFKNGRRSDD